MGWGAVEGWKVGGGSRLNQDFHTAPPAPAQICYFLSSGKKKLQGVGKQLSLSWVRLGGAGYEKPILGPCASTRLYTRTNM